NEEAMCIRIDVRDAAMAALVMQAARRDHSGEQVMRRARGAGAGGAGSRRKGSRYLYLVLGGLSVAVKARARMVHPIFDRQRVGLGGGCHRAGPESGRAGGKKHAAVQTSVAGHLLGFGR